METATKTSSEELLLWENTLLKQANATLSKSNQELREMLEQANVEIDRINSVLANYKKTVRVIGGNIHEINNQAV